MTKMTPEPWQQVMSSSWKKKYSSLSKKAMHVDSPNDSAAEDFMNADSGDFNNIVGTFLMKKTVKIFL